MCTPQASGAGDKNGRWRYDISRDADDKQNMDGEITFLDIRISI